MYKLTIDLPARDVEINAIDASNRFPHYSGTRQGMKKLKHILEQAMARMSEGDRLIPLTQDEEKEIEKLTLKPYDDYVDTGNSLYIRFTDRNGKFRFSIPSKEKVPSGYIVSKGWTVETEYRPYRRCKCCLSYSWHEVDCMFASPNQDQNEV